MFLCEIVSREAVYVWIVVQFSLYLDHNLGATDTINIKFGMATLCIAVNFILY